MASTLPAAGIGIVSSRVSDPEFLTRERSAMRLQIPTQALALTGALALAACGEGPSDSAPAQGGPNPNTATAILNAGVMAELGEGAGP